MHTVELSSHHCDPSCLVPLDNETDSGGSPLRWCLNCGSLLDGDRFHPPGELVRERAAILPETAKAMMGFARWWVSEYGAPPSTPELCAAFHVAARSWRAALEGAAKGDLEDPYLVGEVPDKPWMRRIWRVGHNFVTDVPHEELEERLRGLREVD